MSADMTPAELLAHEFASPCACKGAEHRGRGRREDQPHHPWCPQHAEYAAWWRSLMAAYVRAARDLLADPGRCASAGCGGDDGPYYDDTAQLRTVVGALERAIYEAMPKEKASLHRRHEHMRLAHHALGQQIARQFPDDQNVAGYVRLGRQALGQWSLTHTHAEIMAALDEAVRMMESDA